MTHETTYRMQQSLEFREKKGLDGTRIYLRMI